MTERITFAGDHTVEGIEKASQEVTKFDIGMRPTVQGVDDQN